VQYEISKSIEQGNGLLGIYIHHLKDRPNSPRDPLADLYNFLQLDLNGTPYVPSVPRSVEFPVYKWDGDVKRFAREIEAAGKRADIERDRRIRDELLRRLALRDRR